MTDDCVGEAGSSCRARTSYGAEARPTDRLVPSSWNERVEFEFRRRHRTTIPNPDKPLMPTDP
jgi:hypothetical protein